MVVAVVDRFERKWDDATGLSVKEYGDVIWYDFLFYGPKIGCLSWCDKAIFRCWKHCTKFLLGLRSNILVSSWCA